MSCYLCVWVVVYTCLCLVCVLDAGVFVVLFVCIVLFPGRLIYLL